MHRDLVFREELAEFGTGGVFVECSSRNCGIIPVWSGDIVYDGRKITKMPAYLRPGLGIGHIPQGQGILSQRSVRDNLMLGGYLPAARPQRAEMLEKVHELFPILKTKARDPGAP